jgi:photosystem II stability/assembly factor-like uncharacterized protein
MSTSLIKNISGLVVLLIALFTFNSSLNAQNGWYPLESGTSNVLKSVFFSNASIGYMAGNGIMLKTSNGGMNWLVISESFSGSSVHFTDQYTGYVCEGTIFKTTDGGISWINLNLSGLLSVTFTDGLTGYASGYNSKILKTTDGGVSWEPQFVSLYDYRFNTIYFRNLNTGYIAGGKMNSPESGVIFKTINGGVSWYEVSPNSPEIDFRGIVFPAKDTGYAVGGYQQGSSGVIYRSLDGGESWIQQGIVNKDLNSVHFLNSLTGYTVGETGVILKTTNGSLIWNSQQSTTNSDLHAVYFLKNNLGYAVGNSGSVQKTTSGGAPGPPFAIAGRITLPNGNPVVAGIVRALKYNPSNNTVQIVDTAPIEQNGAYILRNVTQDSLDIMAYPNDEDIDNPAAPPRFVPTYYTGSSQGTISWANSNTIYVNQNLFDVNISVFPTTGSGGPQYIGGGVYIAPPEIQALESAIVYALINGEFKGYSVSRPGGIYDVNNLTPGSYQLICDRMGYRQAERNVSIGNYNLDTINFYMTGINVIGIEPNGNTIPVVYRLEQNFPNPFNPSTKFKVDIPDHSMVKVSVFDMLGREVETLVNQDMKPGKYEVSWNASKFSSGIYFYRIVTSSFTDTKKMILVK